MKRSQLIFGIWAQLHSVSSCIDKYPPQHIHSHPSQTNVIKTEKRNLRCGYVCLYFTLLDRLNRKWLVLKLHRQAIKTEVQQPQRSNVCLFVRYLMWLWCVCVINAFVDIDPHLNPHMAKEGEKKILLSIVVRT